MPDAPAAAPLTLGLLLRESWLLLRYNAGVAVRLFLPCTLFQAVALGAVLALTSLFGSPDFHRYFLAAYAVGLPLQALGVAALVMAASGWHRLAVTGSALRDTGRLFGWGRLEWRYLKTTVWPGAAALYGSLFAAQIVAGVALAAAMVVLKAVGGDGPFRIETEGDLNAVYLVFGLIADLFILAGVAILPLVLARFYIALPAVAVGDDAGAKNPKRLIEGVWLTTAAALLIVLLGPLLLLGGLSLGLGTLVAPGGGPMSPVAMEWLQATAAIYILCVTPFQFFLALGVLGRVYMAQRARLA